MQYSSQESLFNIFIQLFASIIEHIRGPSKLSEIAQKRNEIECLMVYSIQGYTVNIHCQEKQYLQRYKYFFVRDKIKTIYHVFTEVSDNAPDNLKRFCSEDKHFPKLLSFMMPSASQKEAAVNAYLDLIIQKFKNN